MKWLYYFITKTHAAAAAKLLRQCPTLCDPIVGSPPGSPVPGILQARALEWVAISLSEDTCQNSLILKVWDIHFLLRILLSPWTVLALVHVLQRYQPDAIPMFIIKKVKQVNGNYRGENTNIKSNCIWKNTRIIRKVNSLHKATFE